MLETDVTVIGAGIAGLSVARELARYRLRIAVVDREVDVGSGSTRASSSIIHADYGAPGTRTAEYTVRGNPAFDALCRDLAVPFQRRGAVFAAFAGEEGVLEKIVQAAEENGAVPFRRLSREDTLELEPNLNPEIVAGALAPSAGALCSFDLAIALYENLLGNGVVFRLSCEVSRATVRPGQPTVLHTSDGDIRTNYVVNAAGLHADEVASMLGAGDLLSVTPERGQEVVLDRATGGLVNRMVFDCGLGLVVPTTHGNLLLGTTQDGASDKDRDVQATADGLETILSRARRLVPALDRQMVIRSFAGLRACTNRGDHVVEGHGPSASVVVCLQTGGVTASPAAAEDAVAILQDMGLSLVPRDDFEPTRQPIPSFREMDRAERERAIRRDPRWGRIVCRCETVTEGEIVEAIRRGARTLDGVKYRVRAGMGRCQGGFCGPRVMEILARELGLDMAWTRKRGGGSWLVEPRPDGREVQ